MKLLQFDLEKALAGEPVVTRCGFEVTQITVFDCSSDWSVVAVVGGSIVKKFLKSGHLTDDHNESAYDLFMKAKN